MARRNAEIGCMEVGRIGAVAQPLFASRAAAPRFVCDKLDQLPASPRFGKGAAEVDAKNRWTG
jgi:hypothetical protein